MELDHKLIQSTQDSDLVFALNADSWLKENTPPTSYSDQEPEEES